MMTSGGVSSRLIFYSTRNPYRRVAISTDLRQRALGLEGVVNCGAYFIIVIDNEDFGVL